MSNALSGFDCLRFDRNKTRELCGFFLKLRKNLSEELEVIYILHTYISIQPLFIHDILLGNKIVQQNRSIIKYTFEIQKILRSVVNCLWG